jgi:hypothetical protein
LGIILAATSTRTHLNRLHLISPGYRFRLGRLLKLAPKTVISISAFCSRYWVGIIFFGLAEGMFASPTLDALVNAAASFPVAIGQQLVFVKMSRHRQSFLRRPLHMPKKTAFITALREAMPDLTNIAAGEESRPAQLDKYSAAFSIAGEKQEKAADEKTLLLLERSSGNPGV